MTTYEKLVSKSGGGRKQLAVLIDPDKSGQERLHHLADSCNTAAVDFIFVGGSLMTSNYLEDCLAILKNNTAIPLVLFPGDIMQISAKADAMLLLSLISGRNPDLLIGKHVVAAPYLKECGLELIPTGYMLIESGNTTTALYMSGTLPIPSNKPDIAVCTAMAGEMLGLKTIYMDAGSGAQFTINSDMISAVKQKINIPLIVGGGIRDAATASSIAQAGADVVVVGNAIETDSSLIRQISDQLKTI